MTSLFWGGGGGKVHPCPPPPLDETLTDSLNTRGGPTCVHESLHVQCIDVLRSRDNVQAKCTELVVIRARMSTSSGSTVTNATHLQPQLPIHLPCMLKLSTHPSTTAKCCCFNNSLMPTSVDTSLYIVSENTWAGFTISAHNWEPQTEAYQLPLLSGLPEQLCIASMLLLGYWEQSLGHTSGNNNLIRVEASGLLVLPSVQQHTHNWLS